MNNDEVRRKIDAARTALFALEEALGEPGAPLRQRVYLLRIDIDALDFDVRSGNVFPPMPTHCSPFIADDDVHVTNAMALFSVRREQVTKEQRDEAKRIAVRAWAEGYANSYVEFAGPGEPRCGWQREGKPCCLRAEHVSNVCVFDANPPAS